MFDYEIDQQVPRLSDMPLLADFVESRRGEQPLDGVAAVLIQHQLGNQVPMVEALVELGLDPARITWLDVPYTASSRVRHHVTDHIGVPEENFWVNRYRVLDPYATYQRRRAQELVRNTLRQGPERLIVLDDGAYFVAAAAAFAERLGHVGVVEQTTRGFIRLEDNAAYRRYARSVPMVNVAGSTPKLDLEPPWIGVAVNAALGRHLASDTGSDGRDEPSASHRALVLGYGTIGSRVAAALSTHEEVYVFDTDPVQSAKASADGFELWSPTRDDVVFGLVVGCTGRSSFGVGDYIFLDDHAVLASASSGSVEFSRSAFIDLAVTSGAGDIGIDRDSLHEDQIHHPLKMKLVDREVTFLNGGFPINFDGRVNCIPARYMQPTALLMVQGALQAASADKPGCVQIEPGFCRWLDSAFRELLSETELQCLPAEASEAPRDCW